MYSPLSGGYTKEDFKKFIEQNNVAAIAVLGEDWSVQVTTVFYAIEKDMCLLLKSHTGSNHGASMQKNSKVALAIYDNKSTYTVKSGVQLRGIVERITDFEEMKKAVEIYSKTFEGSAKRFATIDELISKDVKSTLFRIRIISGKMLTPEGYSETFQKLD